MARRVHCPKRNGWISCRLACWNASVIVSTAEMGTKHLSLYDFMSKVLRTGMQCKSNSAGKIAIREVSSSLLVTQRFHWIELRRTQRGNQSAYDAHQQ